MNVKKLFLLIAVGLFCSCDHGYEITYTVVNSTSSELKVSFDQPSGQGLGALYKLKPNEEVTIFHDTDIGHPNEEIAKEQIDSTLTSCLTLLKGEDTLKYQTKDLRWSVESFGDTLAKYRLIINSDSTK